MKTAPRAIPPITPEVEAKLWANIEKRPDGKWAWTGARVGENKQSARILIGYVPYYVNRVVFVWKQRQTTPGYQIPDGMFVCHRNDVTPEIYDCNPDNLWLGTHQENMKDRSAKNRVFRAFGKLNGAHTKPECVLRGDKHPARLHPERMARGERQGSAKLTWEKVHEIRALYAAGAHTHKELASRFGVAHHTIKAVAIGKIWRSDRANAYASDTSIKARGAAPISATPQDVIRHTTTGSPSSG
jgi:hypothetical protein